MIKLQNGQVYKSNYKLTVDDYHAIGAVACQNHWYDTCIQWLTLALKKSENISEIERKELKHNYEKAIKSHDKYLETRGPVSKDHRCFSMPFDKNLRKKKKYKKNRHKKIVMEREYHPLFEYKHEMNLKDNNLFTCKEGEVWRSAKDDMKLVWFATKVSFL